MNDSRPPMNSAEFLDGMTPVWFVFPDGQRSAVVYILGNLCRWVISERDRKHWTCSVITKGVIMWDDLIKPNYERIEVMDEEVQKIYYISTADFEENKRRVNYRLYLVRRELWEQELLTMYPGVD